MNDRPYITCRELIDFLYLYLSGELAADRAAEFERHLSVCPSCVEYIASYKQTVALAKQTRVDTDQPLDDTVPEELVAASLLQQRETRELVRQSIDRLPETYRSVLLLRDIEELDTEETARLLEITENAVKIRLHRARQALREMLNPAFRRTVTC